MHTDSSFLTLSQWFSPAFPVGAFAYSHGLEAAIEAGKFHDAASLRDWIEDILRHGSGRSDALLLAAAHRAEACGLAEIDETARAFAPSRERLMETDLQGAAFCRIIRDAWGLDIAGLTYPVAIGRAAGLLGLPLPLAGSLYLQAFAGNLVAVGQRLVPIGQTEAQTIIRALAGLCLEMARDTAEGRLDTLTSSAFAADIASMKHETQYSRIFRT